MIKKTNLFILSILVVSGNYKAQNFQNLPTLVIPNVQPNPTPLTVDTYSRAITSINLKNGFNYGFVSGSATNLLNLNISSYPNYINNNYQNPSTTPSFYSVNPGLEAAVTTGVASVNPMGGFNYNIPIVCSPGTAGMEPKLFINYNSNSDNTWLGLGFNLTGISVISRLGKALFYDGVKSGVKFNSDDVYSLDGARLLLKSGVYGQNGATYKTEVENYYTIISTGTQGNGPQYFTITTPEGLTMEYGKVSTSKHLDNSSTEVLSWYVSKIYDVYGNYMVYSYTNTGGELLINKIEYTGNGSLNPYNKIEFTYIDRSDFNSIFIAGKEFKRSHILKNINCFNINNSIIKNYSFDYQYELASLLTRITEVDANGNALNPTFFDWKHEGISPNYYACNYITGPKLNFNLAPVYQTSVPADLNGDGKNDLVLIKNDQTFEVQFKINTGQTVSCWLGPNAPIEFNQGNNLSIRNFVVEYITSFVFDEDDDDLEEVFIVYAIMSSGSYTYYIDKIKNVGGVLVLSNETWAPLPSNGIPNIWRQSNAFNNYCSNYNTSSFFYAKEDVTGDNLRDNILVDQSQLIFTPSNSQAPIIINSSQIIKTSLGDFDGDGILDIYLLSTISATAPPYLCEVYKYNSSNNTLITLVSTTINIGTNSHLPGWLFYNNSPILNNYANASKSIDFGDFNGDQKTDIMYIDYQSASTGNAHILRSDGLTFLPDNNPLPISTLLNTFNTNFSAMDANNDGYADLIMNAHDLVNGGSYFNYCPSNGNFLTPPIGSQFYNDKIQGILSDFDGDGSMDYLYQSGYAFFQVTMNLFNQNNKKFVNHIFNIKDDLKISYAYLPGQQRPDVYPGAYGAYYKKTTPPVNTASVFKIVKPAIFVVTGTMNNHIFFRYGYNTAIYHRQGKGFLGFEKIFTCDNGKVIYGTNGPIYKGNVSTFTYSPTCDDIAGSEQLETYLRQDIFTIENSKTSAYGQTIMNYTQTGNNRYLSSTISSSKNYLSTTFNVQTTTFDNINGGQILSTVFSNLKWLTQQVINSVQTNYTYQNLAHPLNGSTYFKGLTITESRSANGNTSTYLTNFNYNTQYGYLTSVVKNANLPSLAVTTTYSQFNAFGQALNISITAPDLSQPRTSSLQYDATGRFITQTTNALSLTEQAIYEPGYGNLLQTTDATGLVSKFSYDGLGRLIKTTSPTGAVNTNKYEWYGYIGNFIPPQQYGLKVTSTYEANGTKIIYFNNNDTPAKTESTGFGGNTIVSEKTYDYSNRLHLESQPHFLSQTIYKEFGYSYDEYDRPTAVTEYINNQTTLKATYNYNSLSNTSYQKGFVQIQSPAGNGSGTIYNVNENNEAGQIDKVSNYENTNAQHTSAYTFNEHGSPIQMVTGFPGGQGGATTSFVYDALGRKKTMNDPSSGTNSYDYNSIGELTLTATPNGQYTYAYDIMGRLITKTGSGQGVYTYDYVTSGNGLMNLKKITGPSVVSEFKYDGFNRPIEKKETIGIGPSAKQFKSSYTYDKYSRLVDYTYPGNFKTTNEYDINGYLNKIKNNNTTFWELTTMLSPTLVKDYKNNAGITTQITYDNFQNLQQIALGNLSSQSLTINNAAANMLDRSYKNFVTTTNNYEGFDYDNFDRLTRTKFMNSNNNLQTKQNFYYNANGNLDHKDDCGDYVYGNASKPYELTQITNAANNISLNTLNVVHTDFDKVSQITEATTNKQFDFVYGNNEQRFKMEYKLNSQLQYTRYYQDNYDRQETSNGYKEWSYIYSPTGLSAIYYNDNGTAKLLDVSTDHLGSPILLSDQNGQIVEEYSFDAWGRRRNPVDWTYNNIPVSQTLIRGYTGHEHLDELGIINMNGRVYDPVLGRFIQPDPFVQNPGNIQNFNRYSYVMNNPIKYTDPSGYKNIKQGEYNEGGNPDSRGGGPVLYVDGFRLEIGHGGYDMFMRTCIGGGGGGGGLGVASFEYFGVWTGNGPNLRGITYTSGFFVDFANEHPGALSGMDGRGAYVQLKPTNDPGVFINPITGKITIDNSNPIATVGWTEFGNGMGQVFNAAGIVYGGSEMGIKGLGPNGPKVIGKNIGFGTQRVATALRGTLAGISKIGKALGLAGYGLQAFSSSYKYATGQNVSTAENVGLGISTGFVGAALFAAGTAAAPIVAAGALIYGAIELGSYFYNGNNLEENLIGK